MQDHQRKDYPMFSGLIKYFPDALADVAAVSMEGAHKHGTFDPEGRPTWDRSKSADDADALVRHLKDAGGLDGDGYRHSAKVAWRALAVLQKEIEAADGVKQGAEARRPVTVDDIAAASTQRDKAVAEAVQVARGKIVVTGDTAMSAEAIAQLLGVPASNIVDDRLWTLTRSNLAAVEDFAMWLTRRPKGVLVGAPYPGYELFEALEEWRKQRGVDTSAGGTVQS